MGGGNMGGGYGGQMGNGMGPGMGNGGGGGMQIDQANLNNLMGTLLSNLERNIIQRQSMGGSGGYRDRAPAHRMNDRDRRDRGPLRGVAKGDRGGIRRDRFQPKFTARDRDTHKKPTSSRDSFKSKTDKDKRSTDSKKRESAKKDDEKKEKKEDEKKEEGSEAKKDGGEKSDAKTDESKSKEAEAYCTVCEKFFTGDLVDHRRSDTHKEERQRKFPTGHRRCDVCKISFFRTQQHLWNHLRSGLHKRNTTRAVQNVKDKDKTNDLVTVDTVGYSDDEDGNKKAKSSSSSKRTASDNEDKEAKKSKP